MRIQRGPAAFQPLLKDWQLAAHKAGKKALIVIVPFAGVSDLAFQAYSQHDYTAATPVYVISLESAAHNMEVGKARLLRRAFDDYATGALVIPGYPAMSSKPKVSGDAEDSTEQAVEELKNRCRWIMVYLRI